MCGVESKHGLGLGLGLGYSQHMWVRSGYSQHMGVRSGYSQNGHHGPFPCDGALNPHMTVEPNFSRKVNEKRFLKWEGAPSVFELGSVLGFGFCCVG